MKYKYKQHKPSPEMKKVQEELGNATYKYAEAHIDKRIFILSTLLKIYKITKEKAAKYFFIQKDLFDHKELYYYKGKLIFEMDGGLNLVYHDKKLEKEMINILDTLKIMEENNDN
jgi:hypothetical protein